MPEAVVRVLFVCMGNICRSPTAEGVFRALVAEQGLADRIATDSAGTIRYHQGNPPDERAQSAAAERGIDIGDLRARQVEPRDYHEFDYLIAMDADNLTYLVDHAPDRAREKISLFMDFADSSLGVREVPDPYYGGPAGFDHVFDLVRAASRGLLEHIREEHDL